MSTISTTADRRADAGGLRLMDLVTAAQGLWRACVRWRVEQAAIILLGSKSDRELADIGLPRSEIEGAVRGKTPGSATSVVAS